MNDIDAVIAFYRARLDETEQAARACPLSQWSVSGPPPDHYAYSSTSSTLNGWVGPGHTSILATPTYHAGQSLHLAARHDPARVLRQVASGRALIKMYEEAVERIESYANSIRLEAAVWDDHEDWKPGWRTGWMDEVLGEPLPYRAENET